MEAFALVLPLLCGGAFILMMIVMIPRGIKRAKNNANEQIEAVSRVTGLQQVGNGWEGWYRGLPARIQNGLAPDLLQLYMGSSFDRKVRVLWQMNVKVQCPPQLQLPDLDIVEWYNKTLWNPNRALAQFLTGRGTRGQKLEVARGAIGRRVTVYGTDVNYGNHILNHPEVVHALDGWKTIDVRVRGNVIELNVAEDAIRMHHLYGKDWTNGMIYKRALDVCIAIARASGAPAQ